MQKGFYIVFILFCFCPIHGLSQPIGFAQSECGIISNPNYNYENYTIFPHGAGGCKLYHNGILIFHMEGAYYDFVFIQELKFIDDTTGFMVVYPEVLGSLYIYKIINNSVISLGNCPAYLFNSFIVNRHTIYISSYANSPGHNYLFITKLSDLKTKKELLNTDTIVQDTIFHDTIFGLPLCQGLYKLDYLYNNSNDTLVYTIQFKTDTLVNISQINESSYLITPNPASDFIHIISSSKNKIKSIIILDNLGRKKKSFKSDNTGEQQFYIGDLDNGVYFLIIENDIEKKGNKFIKI